MVCFAPAELQWRQVLHLRLKSAELRPAGPAANFRPTTAEWGRRASGRAGTSTRPEARWTWSPRRSGAERAVINAPNQGTAGKLSKLSIVKVPQVLGADGRSTKMFMELHDEFFF